MAIIQTTSRQFRDKQKAFFDLADKGEKVLIKRGKKRTYLLTPVDNEDIYFTPAMLDKINRANKQVQEGLITKIETEKELNQFLENL